VSGYRSKPTYRVITLTRLGAKVSYIDKSSMDKNELEPKVGSVPFADISNAWAQVHLRQRLLLR